MWCALDSKVWAPQRHASRCELDANAIVSRLQSRLSYWLNTLHDVSWGGGWNEQIHCFENVPSPLSARPTRHSWQNVHRCVQPLIRPFFAQALAIELDAGGVVVRLDINIVFEQSQGRHQKQTLKKYVTSSSSWHPFTQIFFRSLVRFFPQYTGGDEVAEYAQSKFMQVNRTLLSLPTVCGVFRLTSAFAADSQICRCGC